HRSYMYFLSLHDALPISFRDRNVPRVVAVGRRDPLVAGDRLAVHRDLDQRIAIERELERLAHPRVAAERSALRTLAVADIDGDALVADLDDAVDLEAPVALEAGDVGTRQALDEVELPRAQVGEAHRRVDDRQIDDAVEMDRALVPVFR